MNQRQIEAYSASFISQLQKTHAHLDKLELAAIMGYGSAYIIHAVVAQDQSSFVCRKFGHLCANILEMEVPQEASNGRTEAKENLARDGPPETPNDGESSA